MRTASRSSSNRRSSRTTKCCCRPDATAVSISTATPITRMPCTLCALSTRWATATLTPTALQRFLGTHTANAAVSFTQYTEEVDGGSTRDDVATLLQLVHLKLTSPRLDAARFDSNRSALKGYLAGLLNSPDKQFEDFTMAVLSGNHPASAARADPGRSGPDRPGAVGRDVPRAVRERRGNDVRRRGQLCSGRHQAARGHVTWAGCRRRPASRASAMSGCATRPAPFSARSTPAPTTAR